MRQLSPAGEKAISEIASRHGFSVDATLVMLDAVINGNGGMAQFSHSEFAGSGQWMRGGMTMVSDMFNHSLKSRVDSLCSDLASLVSTQPDLVRTGSFQSQSHGSSVASASLFVPGTSSDWWPGELQHPNSTGAQNGVRYAYFAQARRLAIDIGGRVTVYDTLDHHIGGVSQQQSVGGTLSFTSQHGLIDVNSLPVVSPSHEERRPPDSHGDARPVAPSADQRSFSQSPMPPAEQLQGSSHDIVALIERLADLKSKGILSAEEFEAKKAELLGRL